MPLGTGAESTWVIDALPCLVVARLTKWAGVAAWIVLARAEPTSLITVALDTGATAVALSSDAILLCSTRDTGARIVNARAINAVLRRGAAIRIGRTIVRQTIAGRRIASERRLAGSYRAGIDTGAVVVAAVDTRLPMTGHVGTRHAEARIVDAEILRAALLADRAWEFARVACERALAIDAGRTCTAQRAFVGFSVAIVVVAIAIFDIDRLAAHACRRAIDTRRLFTRRAGATTATLRSDAAGRTIACPIFIELSVAIIVDIVARIVDCALHRIAANDAVAALSKAGTTTAGAGRRHEIFVDVVVTIVIGAVA